AVMQLNISDATALIALTFLACGLATVIQAGLFLKYPVIQGMSFASLGAIIAIASKQGFAVCFGSIIISGLVIVALGYLKVLSKVVKHIIPPIVAGMVIVVVGVSLMFTSWNSLITAPGDQNINFIEGGFTAVILIIMIFIGKHPSKVGKFFRSGCVIYAMILGTVFSAFFGNVNLATVGTSPWVGIPDIFHFGLPKFDFGVVLVMVFILFIVFVEAMGTWFTVSVISGEPLEDKRLDKGVVGEGIGSMIGAVLCGVPVTSYGTNSGVIAVTKNLSKWTAVGAGVICVVLAFLPKIMNIIACVPPAVIWGVFLIMTALIAQSGLMSVAHHFQDERNGLYMGLVIMITVGSSLLPAAVVGQMPTLLSYLFGSSITIGSLAAIVLHIILPKSRAAAKAKSDLKTEVEQ
ncbi:uracil-xanthine permease family protein, partial [Parasporobacterium paucivorans]